MAEGPRVSHQEAHWNGLAQVQESFECHVLLIIFTCRVCSPPCCRYCCLAMKQHARSASCIMQLFELSARRAVQFQQQGELSAGTIRSIQRERGLLSSHCGWLTACRTCRTSQRTGMRRRSSSCSRTNEAHCGCQGQPSRGARGKSSCCRPRLAYLQAHTHRPTNV